MNQDVIAEIRDRWKEIIPSLTATAKIKVNGQTSWVCPLCGHGQNGDGLAENPRGRKGSLKCFGCGFSGDVVDLWQKVKGVRFVDAVKEISSALGIRQEVRMKREQQNVELQRNSEKRRNFDAFFREKIPFLAARFPEGYRGISLATLQRFGCGYTENWKHPDVSANVPTSPRLIVPTSAESYLAVDVREEIPDKAMQYRKQKVGAVHWLNTDALRKEKPCFIVEGEIDCLSIVDAGGAAVALGSINQWQRFADAVKAVPPSCLLILAFDNDEKGIEYQGYLAERLRADGIPFLSVDVSALYGGLKDANDALQADRDGFSQRLKDAVAGDYREKNSVSSFLLDIVAGFEANAAFCSTGFDALDRLLGGGLFPGLYVVGAISSLGKTTFCLQIADTVAAGGRDVLFCSLEMSRSELVAKSLSRLTAGSGAPCSTRDILTGCGRGEGQKNAIADAVAEYQDQSAHMFIVEGVGDVTAARIRSAIVEHIQRTGERPLVVVDYLQIIAGEDVWESDKQRIDKAVLELKRISRDFSIPVIAVSSFNRESYSSPVTMGAFKESGAVEYTSDVLIGLQLDGMDFEEGEKDMDRLKRIRGLVRGSRDKAKRGIPVTVQCKVLKNRNGVQGDTFFMFTARHNLYAVAEFGGVPIGKKKQEEISSLFGERSCF